MYVVCVYVCVLSYLSDEEINVEQNIYTFSVSLHVWGSTVYEHTVYQFNWLAQESRVSLSLRASVPYTVAFMVVMGSQ